MTRSLALACLLLLAVTTATASGATAPGRVAFSITGQVPQFGDGGSPRAAASAVLPGGSVVTFPYDNAAQTTVAAKLLRNGALDPAFGTGGMVRLTAPGPIFRVSQSELLADGRLLIAGARLHPTTPSPGRLVLLRLLPDGALDPSFGAGGVLATSLLASGAAPMAVAPDGAIIVTGTLQSPDRDEPAEPVHDGVGRRQAHPRRCAGRELRRREDSRRQRAQGARQQRRGDAGGLDHRARPRLANPRARSSRTSCCSPV